MIWHRSSRSSKEQRYENGMVHLNLNDGMCWGEAPLKNAICGDNFTTVFDMPEMKGPTTVQ